MHLTYESRQGTVGATLVVALLPADNENRENVRHDRRLPMTETMHVETDVLVIGSGAAGMYAAIEAAQSGAGVLLADRSLIGRGGATVMAQMTVAVALSSQTPDHWTCHLHDTLQAGRGLCDESLSRLLCEEGPDCIRQMDA